MSDFGTTLGIDFILNDGQETYIDPKIKFEISCAILFIFFFDFRNGVEFKT